MRLSLKSLIVSVLSFSFLLSGGNFVFAEYPEKMIDFVVPFKAGGGSDRWARVMSSGAIDVFGQPWHVKNIPGADAVVGWRELLKKPADGYAIMLGSPTPIIALLQEKKAPIKPSEIKIVCYVSAFRSILVAKPNAKWSTWAELKSFIEKNPNKLNVGGTISTMIGTANFFDQVGLKVNFIPYSSTTDAVADFLGGHIDLACVTSSTAKSIVPDEAVAVLNTSELPIKIKGLENVPSAKDLGLKGMSFPRWVGVHPDTPDSVVQSISDKMGELLKHKSVAKLIGKMKEEVIFVPYPEAQETYNQMVENMRLALKKIK
jgi:tripartite-type tricarboxylate transporter receptor subunit TctC